MRRESRRPVGLLYGVLILEHVLAAPFLIACNQPPALPPQPVDEQRFVGAVQAFGESYEGKSNELQRSQVRRDRKGALARLVPTGRVANWQGQLEKLGTNSDGKAYISVKVGPSVYIKTWNNAISDIFSNTLIEADSQPYQVLMELNEGATISFSGQFLLDERDYLREGSVTERGSMTSPEFIFRFERISRTGVEAKRVPPPGFRVVRASGDPGRDLCGELRMGRDKCYQVDWSPWVVDLVRQTAGDQYEALQVDMYVMGGAFPIEYPDKTGRLVFFGCRQHACNEEYAYILIDPVERVADIAWKRMDGVVYLGKDANLLKKHTILEWLNEVSKAGQG